MIFDDSYSEVLHAYDDAYYNGGAYAARFGYNKILKREKDTLQRNLINLIKLLELEGKPELSLLDFGCGDGSRFLDFYLNIAERLQNKGLGFNFTGIDISRTGLNEFANNLTKKGFSKLDSHYQYGEIYRKGNITFNLIVSKERAANDNGQEPCLSLSDIISGKKFDASICAYGVLSHIRGRKNRIETLKLLSETCSGYMYCSVAGKARFRRERKLFRDQFGEREGFEDGDLVYPCPVNQSFPIFYHVFTTKSFSDEILEAGIEQARIGISSLARPVYLSWHPMMDYMDGLFSGIISKSASLTKMPTASYLMAESYSPDLEARINYLSPNMKHAMRNIFSTSNLRQK